jgi:hypothetical protein
MERISMQMIIENAIDELNNFSEGKGIIPKSPDVVLAGDSAVLSSLQLVTLISEIEEQIEERLNQKLSLLEGMLELLENEKSVTVSDFVEYLSLILGEGNNGE